jgi:hypothetical protein
MINTQVIKRKKPRNKLTEYDKFAKDAPKMPDYTCPAIDNVLEYLCKSNQELEKIRLMNSQLRDNAEYWKNCCEEMQETLDSHKELIQDARLIINKDI